jgi:hypothetical protein
MWKKGETNGFQSFRMRIIFRENGLLSMLLDANYFNSVGAFEVNLLKVSALKLSHPSASPFFLGIQLLFPIMM